MKATQKLHEHGQSLWLDHITRENLNCSKFRHYVEELSVTGVTFNPTIFNCAIKNSSVYDVAIRKKLKEDKLGEELFYELALEDLSHAADLLRPIFEKTGGVDGWVSMEVSPLLIHETATILAAAEELYNRVRRPNFFIKIPGTKEGLPAVEEAIFAGIPVKVTLLFSREHYLAAAGAFLRGIERRIAAGLKPNIGSSRLNFCQSLGRRGQGQSAGCAVQSTRHRHRPTHLHSLPRPVELTALAAREQCRRPAATPPLGRH